MRSVAARRAARAANGVRASRTTGPVGRASVRCGGGQCRRRLELLDDLRRGGDVEPERPNEAQEEPLVARVVVVVTQRAFKQYRVLGERLRDVEVAEALGHQVREMQGVELGAAKLVRQDRVDRPVDDRRLDLGARVDPDHGGGVKDRVEVVVARLLVERLLPAPRPDADPRLVERDAAPLRGVARVRPDQEPGVGEHAALPPDRRDPPPHERHLVRSDELGRADVEHDRLRRVEADLGAERLARAAGLPSEPVVVSRRPGQPDALGGQALELDGLLLLELVPDEHPVRGVADEALVGQVVPAEHEVDSAHAAPLRRADVVRLRRAPLVQMGGDEQVGRLIGDEPLRMRRRRQRALEPAGACPEGGGAAGAAFARELADPVRGRRRLRQPTGP